MRFSRLPLGKQAANILLISNRHPPWFYREQYPDFPLGNEFVQIWFSVKEYSYFFFERERWIGYELLRDKRIRVRGPDFVL